MLLQIQKYEIAVDYRPGKEVLFADALFKAYSKTTYISDMDQEI